MAGLGDITKSRIADPVFENFLLNAFLKCLKNFVCA